LPIIIRQAFKTIIAIFLILSLIFIASPQRDIFSESISILTNKSFNKFPLLFDHSVKILNSKPNSYEAMYLLESFITTSNSNYNSQHFQPIYFQYDLKNVHSLGNVNESTCLKIMLSTLLVIGIADLNDDDSPKEFELNVIKGFKFFKEIITNCTNNDFKALVEFIIIIYQANSIDRSSYNEIDQFILKYPNHKFNAKLNLYKIMIENNIGGIEDRGNADQINKLISQALKYAKIYENEITPFGYSIADEYYYFISTLYLNTHNFKKSIEYAKMLKKHNFDSEKTDELIYILNDCK